MTRDRMQQQRFELKYVLDESTALGIRDFVQDHLDLDDAGAGKPDYAYRVNSIYLDSANLYTFWDWVNANRNRFKLRMRFYDSHPDTPLFLEIKRRVSGCILKQRCGIRKHSAPLVLAGQSPALRDIVSRGAKGLVALERFIALIGRLRAKPQALVTYWREAYIGPGNDGVRVTLDREVRISLRTTCDFSLHMDRCSQPFGDKVILELKFNNRFPGWFSEMIQLFNLTPAAAAKYCEGLAALCYPELGNGSADLVRDRVTPSRPEWMSTLLSASPTGIAGMQLFRPPRMNANRRECRHSERDALGFIRVH